MFKTCMKAIHKYNNLKVIFAELGKKNWRKLIEKIMSYLSFFEDPWNVPNCTKNTPYQEKYHLNFW